MSSASGITTATAKDELVANVAQTSIQAGETLTVNEPALTGYDADLVCTNATVAGSSPNWSVSVPFSQSAAVSCTLTNDRRPTFQLSKTSSGSTGSFDFTMANLSASAMSLSTIATNTTQTGAVLDVLDLGQDVVMQETAQAGWSTANIRCQDQNGPISDMSGTNTMTIGSAALANAEDVVCAFTNVLSSNDIQLSKSVSPEVASADEIVTYSVTVQNLSSAALSLIHI